MASGKWWWWGGGGGGDGAISSIGGGIEIMLKGDKHGDEDDNNVDC